MIHCKLHATIGTCLYVTCANFYCCCNTLRKIRSYGRCKGTRHINPFTPRYLLVTCRCRAWVAGCFKCPTRHIGQVDSWTRWQSPPWPQILVTCSNVSPHVDWRKFLLNSNLLLLVYSFNSCPFVPYRFLSCVKKQCGSTPSLPVKILYVSMRSPCCLLFSSEVSFSLFSLSSYGNLQKPLTILVALLWTLSRQSISLRRYGDQVCMAYGRVMQCEVANS